MIKIYNDRDVGLVKVFFAIEDNRVKGVTVGNQAVSIEQGYQFFVEEHVAEQLHKCKFSIDGLTPCLRLKEGETLITPHENEEYKQQKEIAELEERLNELKNAE